MGDERMYLEQPAKHLDDRAARCPWPRHLGEWCFHEGDPNLGMGPDGPRLREVPEGLCPNCLRPTEEHRFASSYGPDPSDEWECPPVPWEKAS